ncbi:MAG: 4Fe-4S dicluster domain-containing protein [Ruminococcaceae bacterium]|nr:4Fe-4S dicluster domain-containing protein [Oscillospiraceae bacterium]
MIIYFSGTGNSKFVADYLAEKLEDTTVSLNNLLKKGDKLVCSSEKPYIIVAPIYAWRLPSAVEEILKKSELSGCKTAYCVATMGENSGNADKYIEKIFTDKGMNFTGFTGVPMQNNYLLMEVMPDKTVVSEQFPAVISKLNLIADKIKHGTILHKDDKTPLPALMSGLVNRGFNNFMLKNQKYSVNEKCILCSKCIQLCPTNNIISQDNSIIFSNKCMACFACLHSCPVQAINIEGKTENKGRYLCPDYAEWKLHN